MVIQTFTKIEETPFFAKLSKFTKYENLSKLKLYCYHFFNAICEKQVSLKYRQKTALSNSLNSFEKQVRKEDDDLSIEKTFERDREIKALRAQFECPSVQIGNKIVSSVRNWLAKPTVERCIYHSQIYEFGPFGLESQREILN